MLLCEALQTVIQLKSPVLVGLPEDNSKNSVWGLRRKLVKAGWQEATPEFPVSIISKRFHGKNIVKQYLCMMLDRRCVAAREDMLETTGRYL